MLSHTSLPAGASTVGFNEPAYTDPFLTELRQQVSVYTTNYLKGYTAAAGRLRDRLQEGPAAGWHREPPWRTAGSRWRRQLVSPGVAALQNRYTNFFAAASSTNTKRKNEKSQEEELPIVLVPEEDQTECVSNNQLSSFGFLGFVLNVVNAVINVANNLNNNNNSNNDNNNNNNNNDLNTNQVEITETVTNTNTAAGRRIQRLKMMRDSIDNHMRRIQTYKNRNRRSSCGNNDVDVVDEALLAAVALLDMWKELLFEEDPFCLALEVCQTAGKLSQVSRLSGVIGQVGAAAAAGMLLNFQGVNPEYLVAAAERGAEGANCTSEYPECEELLPRRRRQ